MPDDVFALFLQSRVAIGCVTNTLNCYQFQLGHWKRYLSASKLTYDTAKLIHLQQHLAELRQRYAPATVRQASTTLITFYRWLVEVELLTVDPTVKLKRPKVPDHIPRVAARSYVQHMLDSIQLVTWIDHRDKLIIRILFCTGIRVGECAGLRVSDVDLSNRRLALIGKGGKLRYQPFPEELVQPLWQWLQIYRPPAKTRDGADSPWLFFAATNRGVVRGAITVQSIYNALRSRAETAALDWIPPHGYRHGFAVDMLKLGASTRLIQALLGHASIQTTERYLKLQPDLVQGQFDELWRDL